MSLAGVQETANVSSSGTPASVALSIAPTAGNALVVYIRQLVSAASKTYSISDDIDGTTGWTKAVGFSTRNCEVWFKANVPAGITTVTVTVNSGTNAFVANVVEYSGFGTVITVDASDGLSSLSGAHKCSSAGITSANEVLAACAVVADSTSGTTNINPGATYVETPLGGTSVSNMAQWHVFPTGCTSETGAFTLAGTDHTCEGAIALLSGNGAAAFVPPADIIGNGDSWNYA